MAASVIKSNTFRIISFILSFLVLISIITFINKLKPKTLVGDEINDFIISPKSSTYHMELNLKGELKCPSTFQIIMDGKVFDSYRFEGKVDTIIAYDWYQNKLSFQIRPDSCIDKKIRLTVKLYD